MLKPLLLGVLVVGFAVCSAETVRPTLSGMVIDSNGKPLADTTVMVYHAGVKTGYSTFCPSCYTDCGKRVVTDTKGHFKIESLSPDLWFELLAVHDGYVAQFAKKVDPAKSADVTITLAAKPVTTDFLGVVRGRVVDAGGAPIRDAVIDSIGVIIDEHSSYGSFPGLEPVAVTNRKGEFEISYAKPTPRMMLSVEARAMAPRFVTLNTGPQRHSITLSEGVAIAGRLMADGKPVGNAEIGLIAKDRGGYGDDLKIIGDPYSEVRIGTKPDGSFLITNVPEPVDWYVYAKMDSISQRGATTPVEVKTSSDHEYLKAADLVIQPGYHLKGTVHLSDNKTIPNGMHVTISSDRVWDTQTTTLASDGHFEFKNLPAGSYSIFPSVKGYRITGTPNRPFDLPVTVDHDVDGFVITVHR